MRRYFYITIIAVIAILCLQAKYIRSLYNHYIYENTINFNAEIGKTIDSERRIRNSHKERRQVNTNPSLKVMINMTPQERDSLSKLPGGKDTVNIIAAQKAGVGGTIGEIYAQVEQDILLKSGHPINLNSMDSIWNDRKDLNGLNKYNHQFVLCNKDSIPADSAGNLMKLSVNYSSKLIPIGTKGLQFLRMEAHIPMSRFISHQIWTLFLSGCMMIIVLGCLGYQLLVIRRKETLLKKREMTINGTIHDLKSPLNSVITLLGWLQTIIQDKETEDTIATCKMGVKHLVSNIESLLMTARMDRGKIVLNKVPVDLLSISESVKEELDRLFAAKPHVINITSTTPEGMTIDADPMYMENVMRNLMENALKYSDKGVKVDVVISAKENNVEVEVKDNGWGIEKKFQKKMFTQFYQVPRNGKEKQKGYGIGLAQSKYIIETHKGRIHFVSEPSKGSIFSVTLPK